MSFSKLLFKNTFYQLQTCIEVSNYSKRVLMLLSQPIKECQYASNIPATYLNAIHHKMQKVQLTCMQWDLTPDIVPIPLCWPLQMMHTCQMFIDKTQALTCFGRYFLWCGGHGCLLCFSLGQISPVTHREQDYRHTHENKLLKTAYIFSSRV